MRNAYASLKTFGADAFADDEAIRPRIDQGRQELLRRPFSIESEPIVASQKRSGPVRRHARQSHPQAQENTIPIIPQRQSRRGFVQSGFNEVRSMPCPKKRAADLTEASRFRFRG
ncbi:MAG TPA: hypothetical protein VIJ17_06245 [Pseudolabrys sp.]